MAEEGIMLKKKKRLMTPLQPVSLGMNMILDEGR